MLKCKDELSIMFEFVMMNVSISKIFEYHELRWITSLCRGKFTEKQANLLFKTLLLLIAFGSAY